MMKKFAELAAFMAGRGRVRKNDVERRGKEIEYIYIFAPREHGIGFDALCRFN